MFLVNLYRKFEDRAANSFFNQPEAKVRLITRLVLVAAAAACLLYYFVFWQPLGSFTGNLVLLIAVVVALFGLAEFGAHKLTGRPSAGPELPVPVSPLESSEDIDTTQEFDWQITDQPVPTSPIGRRTPPPAYDERRYYMDFVLGIAAPVLLITVSLVGLILLLVYGGRLPEQAATVAGYMGVALVLTILLCVFAIFRRKWIWDNWRITCDPEDGLLNIHEPGNKWWFIGGSPPDPFSVDEVKLVTPKRSWLHEWLFAGANQLQVEGSEGSDQGVLKSLDWVPDTESLLAIQSYRKRIRIEQGDETIRLARAQLEATLETNRLLKQRRGPS